MQPIELNGSVAMVTKRNTYIRNCKNYFTPGYFRQSQIQIYDRKGCYVDSRIKKKYVRQGISRYDQKTNQSVEC